MSFQLATVPSTLTVVFFVSSGCDNTATANEAVLERSFQLRLRPHQRHEGKITQRSW